MEQNVFFDRWPAEHAYDAAYALRAEKYRNLIVETHRLLDVFGKAIGVKYNKQSREIEQCQPEDDFFQMNRLASDFNKRLLDLFAEQIPPQKMFVDNFLNQKKSKPKS